MKFLKDIGLFESIMEYDRKNESEQEWLDNVRNKSNIFVSIDFFTG